MSNPELSAEAVDAAVGTLTLMAFFPSDPHARATLIRALKRFVETEEQLNWLVERALDLYPRWPGLGELRALYCSRYRPADGVEAYSEIYEQGFPHQSRAQEFEPAPADAPVSDEKTLDAKVREIAKGKRLP